MISQGLHLEFIAAERAYLEKKLQLIRENRDYFTNLLSMANSLSKTGKNRRELSEGIRDCRARIKMYDREEDYIKTEDQRIAQDTRGYLKKRAPLIIYRVARRNAVAMKHARHDPE